LKSIGIVRKVDELGRIVIPIEIRRNLDIDTKDSLEIFIDEDKIILKKYSLAQSCVFCGEAEDVNYYKDKSICDSCLKELKDK